MWKLILYRFYTELINVIKIIIFPSGPRIHKLPRAILQKKNDIHYIYSYKDPNVRNIIHRIKFSKDIDLFKLLGKELSRHIPKNHTIIPTPQTKQRLRERGYDVTYTLAKEIQKHIDVQIENTILKNIRKDVQSQIKNRDKRINSVTGTMQVINKEKIKNNKFIILDDVFTTGSTIKEVERVIIKNSGKVIIKICIAN